MSLDKFDDIETEDDDDLPIISVINPDKRTVTTSKGKQFPITDLIDKYGDLTENWDEAIYCVAGSDKFGWMTISLNDKTPLH